MLLKAMESGNYESPCTDYRPLPGIVAEICCLVSLHLVTFHQEAIFDICNLHIGNFVDNQVTSIETSHFVYFLFGMVV